MGLIAAVGLVVGGIGLFASHNRRSARLGVVLNGAVVACMIFVVLAVITVRTLSH